MFYFDIWKISVRGSPVFFFRVDPKLFLIEAESNKRYRIFLR